VEEGGDRTLLQVIAEAGGYTEYADRTNVKIVRGKELLVFNARRIEKRQDRDPLIMAGDVVVVERAVFWKP
jgi:protein involved in polysaccharide export with SLBB domain